MKNLTLPFRISLIILAVLLLIGARGFATAEESGAIDPAVSEETNLPFTAGERLTYSIKWGMIQAGTAVLEVHPMTEFRGENVHHFSLSLRTTPFVDNFYKVRDRIDGFVREGMEGSVLYLFAKGPETKNPRDVQVIYDAESGFAQYSNFGEDEEPVEIQPGTFDPLSVLFALRAQPLIPGAKIDLPVSDGKDVALGTGHVRRQDEIRVPAGDYEAVLVEPVMKDVGGVFEGSDETPLQIWFSVGDGHLPVRISSDIAVGSFQIDLVSIEQLPLGKTEQVAKASTSRDADS